MNLNSTQIGRYPPPPKKTTTTNQKPKKNPKKTKNKQKKLQWYSEGPSDTHCARTNALKYLIIPIYTTVNYNDTIPTSTELMNSCISFNLIDKKS